MSEDRRWSVGQRVTLVSGNKAHGTVAKLKGKCSYLVKWDGSSTLTPASPGELEPGPYGDKTRDEYEDEMLQDKEDKRPKTSKDQWKVGQRVRFTNEYIDHPSKRTKRVGELVGVVIATDSYPVLRVKWDTRGYGAASTSDLEQIGPTPVGVVTEPIPEVTHTPPTPERTRMTIEPEPEPEPDPDPDPGPTRRTHPDDDMIKELDKSFGNHIEDLIKKMAKEAPKRKKAKRKKAKRKKAKAAAEEIERLKSEVAVWKGEATRWTDWADTLEEGKHSFPHDLLRSTVAGRLELVQRLEAKIKTWRTFMVASLPGVTPRLTDERMRLAFTTRLAAVEVAEVDRQTMESRARLDKAMNAEGGSDDRPLVEEGSDDESGD